MGKSVNVSWDGLIAQREELSDAAPQSPNESAIDRWRNTVVRPAAQPRCTAIEDATGVELQITSQANAYLSQLLAKETDVFGVQLSVIEGGTPHAEITLQFADAKSLQGDEKALQYGSLIVYISPGSETWLDDAKIDYVTSSPGQSQLTIKAPLIKGKPPASDAPLIDQVRWVISTEINPYLASHGGHATVVEVSADGVVSLHLGGGCQGCGQATQTLQRHITTTLLQRLPALTAVRDVTDHATGQAPYWPRVTSPGQ